MAGMNIKNIADWSLKKKIITSVILLLIAWILWSIFGGANAATMDILKLPEGSIQVLNNDGEKITLDIKIGESNSDFSNVSKEVVEKTVLYTASSYPASAGTVFENVSIPIEAAFFGEEGKVININEIPADTKKTYNPEKEYQYVIMARDGYFADNDISVENGSKLLVDTLEEKSD